MNIFKRCPVCCCSNLQSSDILLHEGHLLKCLECGQLLSQCTDEIYNEHMKRFDNSAPVDPNYRMHAKRLKKVLRYCNLLPCQTRLLDVGCSIGLFIEKAKEKGYVVTGVEPAAKAVEMANKKGLDVKCGFLHEQNFQRNYYDVITLFEVIEHLKNPAELLKECHRILKPGGLMFISTGNTDSWSVSFLKDKWDYFNIHSGHISFFNPVSLYKIADNAGFNVVNLETRSVKIHNQKSIYTKIIAEFLSLPAKIFKKGHDALLIVKKI